MKNSENKKIPALLFAGMVVIFIASCNNKQGNGDTKTDTTTVSNMNKDTMNNHSVNDGSNLMGSMSSMMVKMKAVQMTSDFDIDFATLMIQHHQGAVDMSQQELNTGQDVKMKEMAQRIIDMQTKDIADLRTFISSYKPSGMKHGEGELQQSISEMDSKMKTMMMSGDFDKDFAAMMMQHHKDGVAMAKKELSNGMSDKLKKMAQAHITSAEKDITAFQNWLSGTK